MAIFREKPNFSVDNFLSGAPGRAGSYGEGYVLPLHGGKQSVAADEGSYFNAHNVTAGTGLATAAAPTADSDTAVFMTVYNSASDNVRVYLDYLTLEVTAAGTAGASVHFTHQIDSTNRFSSGGAALTARNVNMDSSKAAVATVNAGAVTATAASGASRKLGHVQLRNVIPVIGDRYRINFGGTDNAVSSLAVAGTAVANVVVNLHPVVLGPGDSWVFTLYLPSQTAASSYEVDMGWIER